MLVWTCAFSSVSKVEKVILSVASLELPPKVPPDGVALRKYVFAERMFASVPTKNEIVRGPAEAETANARGTAGLCRLLRALPVSRYRDFARALVIHWMGQVRPGDRGNFV